MAPNVIARDSLIGMVAGPLVWAGHFVTCYTVVALACAFGFGTAAGDGWGIVSIVLVIVSAAALAIIGGLSLLAYRRWRQAGRSEPSRHEVEARHRFMALSGLLLCILSGTALVYVSVPLFVLATCQ